MALSASPSVHGAFLNPILHPIDSAHNLVGVDGSMSTVKKIADVVANVAKVWVHVDPDAISDLSATLTRCKFIGDVSKTLGAEGTFHPYTEGKALNGNTSAFNVVLLASKTFNAGAQVFMFAQAYVTPELCKTISVEFVALVGTVASATGSQTVLFVANTVTDIGLGTFKNCSLIFILGTAGVEAGFKVWKRESQDVKQVLAQFKTFESLGKATILLIVVSGVGTPLLLPMSLGMSVFSLVHQLQKNLDVADKITCEKERVKSLESELRAAQAAAAAAA